MRRRPRPKTAILVLLLPLAAILLGSALMWRFATATTRSVASIPSEPISLGEPLPEPAAPAVVLQELAPALAESAFLVVTGILRPGQTLGASLREQGVTAGTIDQVSSELSSVFNFRYAKPGDNYRLLRNGDGRVVDFEFVRSPRESYRLRLDGDRYVAEKHAVEVTRRATRIAGLVSTSLHEAILDLGESAELAGDFAEIFAWDVDFSRAVQPGDEFQILYERMYAPGRDGIEEYLGPGRILAAHYDGAAGDHTAVHFEFAESRGGYYRPDGSSIRRQFLQAPLKFSRISSRYTQARFHPILKITRPHHGIDYAAPVGTPVFSVADGTVVHMGWSGGYGRLVKIRHADGYVSFYGHLSRYAPGLRVGKTVQQKQAIGSVGSSGLSTGPHVCFRITKNGRFVNPATQNVPNSPPIPGNAVAEFRTTRDARLAELGTPLVVTQEAL